MMVKEYCYNKAWLLRAKTLSFRLESERWEMAYLNARRTLASTLSRALSSSSASASRFRFAFAFALLPAKQTAPNPHWASFAVRTQSSGSGYSPLNDPSPNWSNRPPKETILLDGCDYEHWLIVMEFPDNPKPSEDHMVNAYVKTLAQVLGRSFFPLLIV